MLRLLVLFALVCPVLAQAQTGPASSPPPSAQPAPAPVAPAAPPEAFPQQQPAPQVQPPPPPAPGTTYGAPGSPYAAPTPGSAYPAPPPGYYGGSYGYGYAAPPASDPERARALGELQNLDLRIAAVRKKQKQHGIVGPAAMTASGYAIAVLFGAIAVWEWAIAEDIRQGDCSRYRDRYDRYDDECDVNNDGYVDGDDRRDARTLSRAFGAVSAVGAGLGIAGTVFLVRRLGKRRAYAPELRDLGVRRGQLLQQLRYGGGYSHNGVQLSISGRF